MLMHSELAVEQNSEVADNFDWCDRGCIDVETEICSCLASKGGTCSEPDDLCLRRIQLEMLR